MAIASGFANARNTGVPAGTALTAYTGPMTITQANTVIDGKIINGALTVLGENVVIKNCKITFSDWWGINADQVHKITVQNCEIVGPGYGGNTSAAILGSGTFVGNNIHHVDNGIMLTEGASVVKGNYIHDLSDSQPDPHYDGIGLHGGQNGVLIEDNTVVSPSGGTSGVFIKNDFGAISNVQVNHNFLTGGAGYQVYVDASAHNGAITGVSVTNNYITKGDYGYYVTDGTSPTMSGNTEALPGSTPTDTDPTTSTVVGDGQTFWGTSRNDNLPSTGGSNAGSDTFWARNGNDTIVGGAGGDKIDGGAGMDVSSYLSSSHGVTVDLTTGKGIGGDAAGDTLTGIEALTGSGTADTLSGNSGYNVLRGKAGANVLNGMGGNDTLNGGSGGDKIDGGGGADTSSYWGSSHSVMVNLATHEAIGGDATGDKLTSIENLAGSDHADALTGNSQSNLLSGRAGSDVLKGLGGDDALSGGSGADDIDGGAGSDGAIYGTSKFGVQVDLTTGKAAGGDAAGDTLTSIENLAGSGHDDALRGNTNANVLKGYAGADVLDGVGGDDVLVGGDGGDTLLGGNGNDRLVGGRGTDTLTGGAGDDSFVFDTPIEKGSADTITDFSSAHDTILLDHSTFSKLATGHLSADNFHAGSAAADGNDYVVYDQRTGRLDYDADGSGSGSAVQVATLVDKPELTHTDVFVF